MANNREDEDKHEYWKEIKENRTIYREQKQKQCFIAADLTKIEAMLKKLDSTDHKTLPWVAHKESRHVRRITEEFAKDAYGEAVVSLADRKGGSTWEYWKDPPLPEVLFQFKLRLLILTDRQARQMCDEESTQQSIKTSYEKHIGGKDEIGYTFFFLNRAPKSREEFPAVCKIKDKYYSYKVFSKKGIKTDICREIEAIDEQDDLWSGICFDHNKSFWLNMTQYESLEAKGCYKLNKHSKDCDWRISERFEKCSRLYEKLDRREDFINFLKREGGDDSGNLDRYHQVREGSLDKSELKLQKKIQKKIEDKYLRISCKYIKFCIMRARMGGYSISLQEEGSGAKIISQVMRFIEDTKTKKFSELEDEFETLERECRNALTSPIIIITDPLAEQYRQHLQEKGK